MSANYMGHTLSLVLALIAFLSMELARKGASLMWGGIAGLSLGLLFLTRPLEGILMSAAVGLRILGAGGPRPPFRVVVTVVIGAILVGGLIFPYNQFLTGDTLYPPHLKWAEETWYVGVDRLGFGPDIGNVGWWHHDPLPGHGFLNVVLNNNKNFYIANFELFGWSFGSLLFVALAFALKAYNRNDILFWGIIVVVIAGNSLHWSPGGPDYAARYWYQTIIPFAVLTVRGAQLVAEKLHNSHLTDIFGSRVAAFVILASLTATVNVAPWRAAEKYHHYKGRSYEVAAFPKSQGIDRGALVFVQSPGKDIDDDQNDFPSAFTFNPPTFDYPDTIYALYVDQTRQEKVQAYFPDRPVWIIGRPEPGAELRILREPR